MHKTIIASVLALATIGAFMDTPASAACTDNKDRWITVNNNSSRPVSRLYASNTRNDVYGSNLLTRTIPPGGSQSIEADDGSCRCLMDLKAESPRGAVWRRNAYDVCSKSEWNLVD